MKRREKIFYAFFLVFLCLISFALGYFAFNKNLLESTKQDTSDILDIRVKPLQIKDIVIKNSYVGYVEAIHQVNITPYISGYLEKILIEPGQYVKKDDLLVSLEDAEYQAKVEAADANLLQAHASLNYNQNYYNRVQKSGKNTFSQTEIDEAQNNFLQAEASLKNAKANKALAEVNLRYTKIKAPISGLVGNFNLTKGDYVAPNASNLFNIVQTDPIRVVFSITDKEYLDMKEDDDIFKDSVIKLTLANGKPFLHEGKIKYTDNKIKAETNSLTVYAYFNNSKNELLPNSYVTVDVFCTFKDSVLLDKNLIKMQDNGYFLTISRQDRLIQQPVTILSEYGDKFVIKNIFQKDDMVVLDNIPTALTQNKKINFIIQNS